MRKHSGLLLAFIILISVFSILVVLPPFSSALPSPTVAIPGQKPKMMTISYPGFSWGWFTRNPNQQVLTFHKGLDLQGGTSITLEADMKNVPQSERQSALDGVRTVLERRVNLYGVSEPVIQTVVSNNSYRVVVDLPGVNNQQARQLVGTTAQLSFWEEGASGSATASPSAFPLGIAQVLGPSAHKTSLTGKDLQNTSVTFDQNTGAPQVQLQFTSEGSQKFADITKRNVGKPLAIVLDNQLIEAPVVNQAILSGNAVITGNFTTQTANTLAIELQAGALPVPLTTLATQTVGATLGQDALSKSLFAGILGFLIVVIFMVVLYGRMGVLASIALFLYTMIVLAIFKLVPVTLTLAGIAGFILTIGMAVDANILIFERLKEELRLQKPLSLAMELGFSRAWSSIRDSNISTLITSAVLFQFGTGIVRGFALTLAIGVIVSMFSAVVVTRTLIRLFYKQ